MRNYMIVGDTAEYKNCLIHVCYNEKVANDALHQMLTNPTESDKRDLKRYTNIRVAFSEDKDCWWDDPFLAN